MTRVLAAFVAALYTGVGLAPRGSINLGAPTGALAPNPHFPLSGFYRASTSVRSRAHPELLFIGTLADAYSAMESWPLVKALNQFGVLSGVHGVQACDPHAPSCVIPSLDFSEATYRSRYLAFAHRDLLRSDGKQFQSLSRSELAEYDRYARVTGGSIPGDRYGVRYTLSRISFGRTTTRGLPLVAVGEYVETESQALILGDFETLPTPPVTATTRTPPPIALSLATVQQSLADGKDPPSTELVEAVNGEANVITALICHADSGKPRSVCGRSVIKSILKHVK